MYKIIALIGEAGCGKDTILKEVLAAAPTTFNEIISCTTRPPREGEADGVNYFFIDAEEFAYKVLNYEMIEATSFNDWFYGTSYDALRSDVPNIGVFNPDGIYALLEREDIELTVFRIITLSKTRLLRQLNREENPNVREVVRRFQADYNDFDDLNDISYRVLENNNEEDLDWNIKEILCQSEHHFSLGQK